MTRPEIQHRKTRGPTKQREQARKAAAGEHAIAIVADMARRLEGIDGETAFEVLRKVAYAVSHGLKARGTEARCIGVLAHALAEASPAYTTGPSKADPNSIFKGEGA